ncbi:hypothetical protein CEW91_11985 [Idiomarina piscisalsi]|uniref:Tyr recombinase domain-containing protein n=1 Tax=Idiomarina piscisalsi TaxID=1096243 RepID=A0ABN5ASA8_9GAMM|nr:integrase family protein [Idiomarina piscisalsi]ASG66811.1 hypothetical protein CEW91_11985 [Idiomarina piscisalsi]
MTLQKLSTPRAIDALKPREDGKKYRRTIQCRGIAKGTLFVLVSSKGKKTFYSRASYSSQRIDIRLGSYPAISLQEAKQKHNENMALIDEGRDPRIVRQADKLENEQQITLNELFDDWFEFQRETGDQKETTLNAHRWRYKKYLQQKLGGLPVNMIDRLTLLKTLRETARISKEQARKSFTTLNLPLDYAQAQQIIEVNPCRSLKPKDVNASKAKPRDRFLSMGEISELLYLLNNECTNSSPQLIVFTKIALITGARRGEIRNMRWADLTSKDNETFWSIKETKNGKPHRISLHKYAMQLINSLKPITGDSEWVFESSSRREQPIGIDSPTQFISRLIEDHNLEHFRLHDLRRTAATQWAEELSADSQLIELMLNHLPQNQLVRTYQVVQRSTEQSEIRAKWEALLSNFGLLGKEKTINFDKTA